MMARAEATTRISAEPASAVAPRRLGSPSSSPELAAQFKGLAERWRCETAQVSDVHEIVLHPSYLRIIGLGPEVVPLDRQRTRLNSRHTDLSRLSSSSCNNR